MLSGSGFFSTMRQLQLPQDGLHPLAVRALNINRSAPPLLTPISTGLTMNPAGLPSPPVIAAVPPVLPMPCNRRDCGPCFSRVRSLLRHAPGPSYQCEKSGGGGKVLRTAPPVANLASRVLRVAAPNAPRPTAGGGGSPHTALAGARMDLRHRPLQQGRPVPKDIGTSGVTLPSGATHLWDIPWARSSKQLVVSGGAAFRITFLTRGGSVSDREYPPPHGAIRFPRIAA